MSRDGGEDGWTSEYDSTWEEDDDDEEEEEDGRRTQRRHNYSRRNRAARDLQCYRHGYRGEHASEQPCTGENAKSMPNLDFYQNKKCFEPNGLCIDELLNKWKDDYNTLERNHSYIQWLFPLREYGMNSYAKPLTLHEIKMMKEDKDVMTRFLKAYKLMLQFYGIELSNEETGEVKRAGNWEDRFKNLNYHSHNNLRITRILKCLGEMGYEHFQAPLVTFLLKETLENNNLPSVKRSVLDYFMFAVKDKHKRRELVHYAWTKYNLHNQDKFIWGPLKRLRTFHPHEENNVTAAAEGPRGHIEEKPESRIQKTQVKGKPFTNICENIQEDEVTTNKCGSKMGKASVGESIPLKERGTLPENSPCHNAKTRPDQSTGLEEEEEENKARKEEHVDREDAKDDSSIKNLTTKAVKKNEHEQDGGLEANGLAGHKRNQGDHQRKRKLSDKTPPADGCAMGDGTQANQINSPEQAEDEGGQVDGVEDEVKKLKLGEARNTQPNRTEEIDPLDDTNQPREGGENPALPSIDHS